MTNPQTKIVVSDPDEAEIRLRAMGLTEAILHSALRSGIAGAALCTLNHPTNFGGLTFWAEATRWLRETLIPEGWRRDNSYGLPTVVRGDEGLAIAVVRGDKGTGNPKANPTTQHPRGTVVISRVEQNGILPGFEHLKAEQEQLEAAARVPMWLLLHYRAGDQLVAELSYPTVINRSGFVEEWAERIILTSIALDPTRMPVLDEPPVLPDVSVRRRAS
jgi:hypothetical protein